MNLKAIFPSGATELTVNGLHQWDYGRKLDIHAPDLPALVEVHFACSGMDEAIVRVSSAVGGVASVAIPDRCLEQSSPITAWVYEVGETSGQTIKTLTLNIKARTRPQAEGTIDPETSDKYTEAVGAMNDTIARMPEQFLLKEGGRISGRLFVDGDVMGVGGTREGQNFLGVNFLSGEPGGVYTVEVLNLFGNGSPANGAGSHPDTRGLYDTKLNKNILEIGKDNKVKFNGEAETAKSAKTAESAKVARALNLSADNILLDAATTDTAEKVYISNPGLYALFIRDDVNKVNISQTVYVYNLSKSFNVSIPGGTLVFDSGDAMGPCFRAISSDLLYNFDILSAVKIAIK